MYLGFDTSNYTTSVALFDGENCIQKKKLLAVKNGEKGLRQSDAVFQHTVNMPVLIDDIKDNATDISAVGVSIKPRNIDGSYMPCFLVGSNTANAVSSFSKVPLYKTSHQVGHILAALYSVNKLHLVKEKFIAFHISGGTTEALLVEPDENEIIKADLIAQSTDLKAGQAVDRAGVLLGMKFPCGRELDALSQKSARDFKIKPSMNGCDCSLSGLENKVIKMKTENESDEDIAKFVFVYLSAVLDEMTRRLLNKYGNLPIVFAGGVTSNSLIRKNIEKKYNAYFADSEYSCDNAAGTAIYAYLKDNKI